MATHKTSGKIRVLLADDHLIVRMGIASLISYEKDMTVVGEANDGVEAVQLVAKLHPDVVVMDLMMPRMNGTEATEKILKGNPTAKVLILTSFGSSADISRALSAGAAGALLKTSSREELISAIRSVLADRQVLSPEIESTVAHAEATPSLSARQLEVLNLAAKGFQNSDIGRVLGISINSVKDHLKLIYSRLNVSTRAEATAFAINQGWITG